IVGFLDKCRQVPSITKAYFRSVSEDYYRFVARLAATQRVQIVQPPKGVRREDWVEPFYQALGSNFGIAVILKSRENARIAVSYPTTGGNRIEVVSRFVWQYYFYVRDADWGRMFLRICPYFPFNARVYVNQHEYCTNLLFEERAALDRMAERLLDLNRTIGRPDKLSTIFGYRVTKAYAGGLKTQIADHHLGNPVIRSEYKQGSIKQSV